MKRSVYISSSAIALLMLSGCMGYRLEGSRPAGVETVSLSAVVNKTDEPALELQITHALRERIQFDGRLKLADSGDPADGIIEVVLTKYDLTPIAYTDKKRTTPQLYRLRVTGTAVLKNAETGVVISSSDTYGEATVPFEADLTSAKRSAFPAAAGEFAKYAVDDLIERW